MAGASADHQPAAGHLAPRLDADIAPTSIAPADMPGADPVEPVAGAFDADVCASPMRSRKTSPTVTRMRVVCSSIRAISSRCLAGEKMRQQRRQIEPLLGALAQRQVERRHGSRSLR